MALGGLWERVKSERATVAAKQNAEQEHVIHDGKLEYTREFGGNDSKPSYQEASGAPVEKESPLGYEISWYTVVFLNIGQMIGTGVFSTRTVHLSSHCAVRNTELIFCSGIYLSWCWVRWTKSHLLVYWSFGCWFRILRVLRTGRLLP